jgi:hypothetical protein
LVDVLSTITSFVNKSLILKVNSWHLVLPSLDWRQLYGRQT